MPFIWKNEDDKYTLFGMNEEQKLLFEKRYEMVYGVFDFITDRIYFVSVLHTTVNSHAVDNKVIKSCLFMTSIFGLLAATFGYIGFLEEI